MSELCVFVFVIFYHSLSLLTSISRFICIYSLTYLTQGADGKHGLPGANGVSGLKGESGASGFPGHTGNVGAMGYTGVAGKPGAGGRPGPAVSSFMIYDIPLTNLKMLKNYLKPYPAYC